MKICSKCKCENKDTSVFCTNCQTSIIAVPAVGDDYFTKRKSHLKLNKRRLFRIIGLIIFILLYVIWALWMSVRAFGNINPVVNLILWFIPCMFFILFPFDHFYSRHYKKQENIEKHLNDLSIILLRSVGVIGIIVVYVSIFDALGFTKLPEKIV